MKTYELLEARKNPELNPKISLNAELKAYVDKFGKDGFISFTSIDKLGINPGSDYDTPIGIYAYPVMYAYHDVLGDDQHARRLPFAGSNPYATLFSATNGVIDLHTFSESDLASAIKKLKSIYGTRDVETSISYALESGRVQTAGGQLWAITMKLSKIIKGGEPPIVWNKIFRSIGINGCVDSEGEDIIHPNEPTQAVFFKKPGVIENEKRVLNKYAPVSIAHRKLTGEERHRKIAELAALRKNDFFAYLGKLDDQEKLHLLTQEELNKLPLEKTLNELYGIVDADDLRDKQESIRRFTNGLHGKRWPACEDLLGQNFVFGVSYVEGLNEPDRIPSLERTLLSRLEKTSQGFSLGNIFEKAVDYCAALKERWPELEHLLLTDLYKKDSYFLVLYSKRVIKGRWPEAEGLLDDMSKAGYDLAHDIDDDE